MKYFKEYTSNTYAGSGNQLYFNMNGGEVRTGRIFYKISVGGEYNYSILFSNIMDSTYSDGTVSHKNLICDSWTILEAKVKSCSDIVLEDDGFEKITFDGKSSKEVMPGEFFATDPIRLMLEKGEYLCLELTFSGKMIPYHEETLLPVYIKEGEGWTESKHHMPFAGMIGCDREVKGRIAYLGDSITQGLGTEMNSYSHWNAVLSEKLGEEYAYWNLGIGFGRANDAAADGAWLYKAKQNDIVVVCFGVNDILQGMPEEQIKDDLTYIVTKLLQAGVRVVLQTVPPFDYSGEDIEKWKRINEYIKTELGGMCELIFDNVPYLAKSENKSHAAAFGGHPNAEGCRIWAEAFYEKIGSILK